jgi:hypothetical protein
MFCMRSGRRRPGPAAASFEETAPGISSRAIVGLTSEAKVRRRAAFVGSSPLRMSSTSISSADSFVLFRNTWAFWYRHCRTSIILLSDKECVHQNGDAEVKGTGAPRRRRTTTFPTTIAANTGHKNLSIMGYRTRGLFPRAIHSSYATCFPKRSIRLICYLRGTQCKHVEET